MLWHAPFEGTDPDSDANLLALGKRGGWSASSYAYPPSELTDHMFLSANEDGYGLYLADFI